MAVLFLLVLGVTSVFGVYTIKATKGPAPSVASLDDCVRAVIQTLKPNQMEVEKLNAYAYYCYSLNVYQSMLGEANVRTSIYQRQIPQNEIMLWMVVAITLMGVILAGLQLLASYNLAMAGKEEGAALSELTVEQNKVALKSSITGLFILMISFAFFFVYVKFVYTITDPTLPRTANLPATYAPTTPAKTALSPTMNAPTVPK